MATNKKIGKRTVRVHERKDKVVAVTMTWQQASFHPRLLLLKDPNISMKCNSSSRSAKGCLRILTAFIHIPSVAACQPCIKRISEKSQHRKITFHSIIIVQMKA